jgi:formate/nitrite transporter FocA (FNT family)
MNSSNQPVNHFDAYAPAKIARMIGEVGVRKARLSALQTITLGILAGAFIAFGGMFYTLVVADSALGLGPTRLLGGVAFSLGLILVIIAGAELFTGNNLIVMAWADRKISTGELLRNWVLVYAANLAGALGSVVLVYLSGTLDLGGGAVARAAAGIAEAKL